MNIFLTGGSGFIGSNFIKLALEYGHKIFAITRNKKNQKSTDGLVWIDGGLDGNYRLYLNKCDVVVHLASYGVVTGSNNLDDYL